MKFEYKIIRISGQNLPEHELNNYGRQGWEVMNVSSMNQMDQWGNPNHVGWEIVFKRKQSIFFR